MKTSIVRSLWIAMLSGLFTINTCVSAEIMRIRGKISRAWVDQAIRQWINQLLTVVKVQCKVINPHNIKPEQGQVTIIMCNHSSLYDIPLSFKAFPDTSIRMLAKKELSRIPLLGKGMKAAEFPFIDRKNRNQALKDLDYARKLMESGIVLWIAPEGTRSKDGKLALFKKGAFITAITAKATIIPIGIRGAFSILPARTLQFNLGQQAEVHIGLPIDASQFSLEQKDELIAEVHRSMKALTGEADHD